MIVEEYPSDSTPIIRINVKGTYSVKLAWVRIATLRWVETSRYGNKYLKTEADGEQPDNLLSLPECP